jgi:adenine-specific DNA-methyltransferase
MPFDIHNRRYIGSKATLSDWILESVDPRLHGGTFFDVFGGTGVVSAAATKTFDKIIVNDFLYSNEVIYRAFFGRGAIRKTLLPELRSLAETLAKEDNYVSANFGGKFFTPSTARAIGAWREAIETVLPDKKDRTRNYFLASLLYSADRSAITVGHYEAFLRNGVERDFEFDVVNPLKVSARIFRQDSNEVVRKVKSDVAYVDPPYNSRQYSRFYHVLETLTKWDSPELFGVALKPAPENISDYCKVGAAEALLDLVQNIDAKQILISYNNTYDSKSSSSRNRVSLDDLKEIAQTRGKVKVLEKSHKHFNAGNTDFADHRELLFVIEVS